jgi:pimeloyl-ACP methyl ester carboxylesterase
VAEITHRTIQTNGINMHIAEAGSGPLVVMCHGWPESWYSWRHQLTALADAGFHAIAPDQRGYGLTDRPEAIDQYTIVHLCGDIVGLLDALGKDHGRRRARLGRARRLELRAPAPRSVHGVIALSVPYRPRATSTAPAGEGVGWGGPIRPTDAMRAAFGDRFFYQLYFQTPGVAEHEFQNDPRRTMKLILYGAGGEGVGARVAAGAIGGDLPPATAFMLEGMVEPQTLPSGSPTTTSISTPTSSGWPASAAASTGIATSTATGSSWAPMLARMSPSPRSS